ncbi:hypothetical protein [Thalassobaculum sp.]|uniref:hypothetical protein n=1 Tax=Thalassobaculum sp. TaxID=2022740 RepID=UPI0032EFE0C5
MGRLLRALWVLVAISACGAAAAFLIVAATDLSGVGRFLARTCDDKGIVLGRAAVFVGTAGLSAFVSFVAALIEGGREQRFNLLHLALVCAAAAAILNIVGLALVAWSYC